MRQLQLTVLIHSPRLPFSFTEFWMRAWTLNRMATVSSMLLLRPATATSTSTLTAVTTARRINEARSLLSYTHTGIFTQTFWFTFIWFDFYLYLLSLFSSGVSVSVATDNDIFIQTHAALVSEISCWCCSLSWRGAEGRPGVRRVGAASSPRQAGRCTYKSSHTHRNRRIQLPQRPLSNTLTRTQTRDTKRRHERQTNDADAGTWHSAFILFFLLCKFLILFILLFILHAAAATLMASVVAAHLTWDSTLFWYYFYLIAGSCLPSTLR